MAAITTCWLIGSTEIAAQTVTIDASPENISAGAYYLYHPTAPSLLDEMVTAMTAAGVAAPAAELLENRKVRLSSSGTFTVTWPADNILRNHLGFSGNLAAASSYTASGISPLLWSPGRKESPKTVRLGINGRTVYNTIVGVGDDGTPCATTHGSRTYNAFFWRYVEADRIMTTSSSGGEFEVFKGEVLVKQYPFNIWRDLTENAASSSAASFGSRLGPYALLPQGRSPDIAADRSKGFGLADSRWDVEMDVYVRTELS